MAQLEYEDVINTVLMRYGNRQGNTALQAQALIELELLMDELYRMPALPDFLIYSADLSVAPNVPSISSAHEDIIAAVSAPFARFVPHTHNIATAILIASGAGLTPEYTELVPATEEEFLEAYELLGGPFGTATGTAPTKFIVRNAMQPYSLDGGLTYLYATGQVLSLMPVRRDQQYTLRLSGYVRSASTWVLNNPNMLVAGLGVRMGTYIKDSEELARFQMEYLLAKKAMFDFDTATEEANKYGNRGVN